MTANEAIKILEVAKAECEWNAPLDYQEAFDLAISALQAQDLQPACNKLATDTISRLAVIDLYKQYQPYMAVKVIEFGKALEQLPSAQPEPCEDAVSRKDAIIQLSHNKNGDPDCDVIIQHDIETLKRLPSVTPKRKTGKWEIYTISMIDGEGCKCSGCGFEGAPYWDFCPNCGADMRGNKDG